jgi:hypothetical protein
MFDVRQSLNSASGKAALSLVPNNVTGMHSLLMNHVHVDDVGIIVRNDTARDELREQVGNVGLIMLVLNLLVV